jgi:hypothetical protein
VIVQRSPDAPVEEVRYAHHVTARTVVLPDLRVMFLPVPKAACTSLLWLLADLAALPRERFARSATAEASPALTIHDMNLWLPEQRLATYDDNERAELLGQPGWLRFSVVRHPATRLWSAWQSKLLMREPRFLDEFGDEPWFPRVPESGADVIEDFRRFVRAVGAGRADDVHWAVQEALVGQLPFGHVGRVEQLGDTLSVLKAHVGEARWREPARAENRSPIAMPADAFDDEAATTMSSVYAGDFATFGYADELPAPGAMSAEQWAQRIEDQLPALRATIDERARLGQLHRVAQRRQRRAETAQKRVEAAERKVEAISARQVGHARSPAVTNLEGETEFNVRWTWADGELDPGFTAVLRVKDEARALPFTLPPLLRAVNRVVLVDNRSSDGTPEIARQVARWHGAADRLEVRDYPFAVARCGADHLATPPTSVHSLVHFYRWSFSQVRTTYALKWDGDMVLTDAAVAVLCDLSWQLEAAEVVVKVPRYPLYLVDDRRAFIDVGLRNCEPWGWPNRPGYSFVKAMDWEMPRWGGDPAMLELPDWGCVELKHLAADEFAHWSDTNFDNSARQARKRREWQVFNTLSSGGQPPDGVEAIVAPSGVHVVDHVRETWLPARARAGSHARAA